ncbi:MAG: DUF2752 domain-containing protein [Deltaproteobacteria bacterium]|nr:DUF2752 domain-containing protein [Deltaproteobacteria bacterium]
MCFVRYFLEIPCPGCGLLHALFYAFQMKWGESFVSFPLWPLVIVFFLFMRRSPKGGQVFLFLIFVQWIGRLGLD